MGKVSARMANITPQALIGPKLGVKIVMGSSSERDEMWVQPEIEVNLNNQYYRTNIEFCQYNTFDQMAWLPYNE